MPHDGEQQPNSCQFATLATYNGSLGNPAMAGQTPVPLTTAVGMQLVPAWHSITYDTLQRSGQFPCNGYPTIMGAYGTNANNCQTQYVKRLCA
jgi:hypothetical protein